MSREHKKRVFRFSLIILGMVGLLVGWLGFGKYGFMQLYRMNVERQSHEQRIHEIRRENAALMKEIDRVRSDPGYMETLARKELGMIKSNEMVYRLRTENSHRKADATTPRDSFRNQDTKNQ
jgi:cell division protein FtsB